VAIGLWANGSGVAVKVGVGVTGVAVSVGVGARCNRGSTRGGLVIIVRNINPVRRNKKALLPGT
jgi:hypothetical protein